MALELQDFTTFIAGGVDGNLVDVISPTHIRVASLARPRDCYFYKDYGADAFAVSNAITLEYEFQYEVSAGGVVHMCSVSSAPGTIVDLESQPTESMIGASPFGNDVYMRDVQNGTQGNSPDSISINATDNFYLRVHKPANLTDWTVEVFSDPDRTVSLGSVTYSCDQHPDRYIQAVASWGTNSGNAITYNIRNLSVDFGAPSVAPKNPLMLGRPF